MHKRNHVGVLLGFWGFVLGFDYFLGGVFGLGFNV